MLAVKVVVVFSAFASGDRDGPSLEAVSGGLAVHGVGVSDPSSGLQALFLSRAGRARTPSSPRPLRGRAGHRFVLDLVVTVVGTEHGPGRDQRTSARVTFRHVRLAPPLIGSSENGVGSVAVPRSSVLSVAGEVSAGPLDPLGHDFLFSEGRALTPEGSNFAGDVRGKRRSSTRAVSSLKSGTLAADFAIWHPVADSHSGHDDSWHRRALSRGSRSPLHQALAASILSLASVDDLS